MAGRLIFKKPSLPALGSPMGQTILLGIIFLCCPGVYNTVVSMAGAGGDPKAFAQANAVLSATFAATSLVAPAVCNIFGVRATLAVGTTGYICFVAGLYLLSNGTAGPRVVMGCAVANGLGAALLWAAQGQMILAYPSKESRGKHVSIFFGIFNMGGVLGGLMALSANWSTAAESTKASEAAYMMFIGTMCAGTALCVFLKDPSSMTRSDGSAVVISSLPSVKKELLAIGSVVRDKRMLAMSPLFLYSNWYWGYYFATFNASLFNARTQGLTSACFWATAIYGGALVGRFLDDKAKGSASRRGGAALGSFFCRSLAPELLSAAASDLLTTFDIDQKRPSRRLIIRKIPLQFCIILNRYIWVWVNASWAAACWIMSSRGATETPIDLADFRASGPFILFCAWGLIDPAISSLVYWTIGQLDSDPAAQTRFAGYAKAVQATGAPTLARMCHVA